MATIPTKSRKYVKLDASEANTNRIKKIIEKRFIHLFVLLAHPGYLLLIYIPSTRGTPSIIKIVTNISTGLIENERINAFVPGYSEPQNKVLNGVMKIAKTVEIADMLIDRGVFPFPKYVKKFDRFPPGQAATKNNPNAMLGNGFMIMTNKKVKAGSRKNCATRPINTGFGVERVLLKSPNFRSSATPNIINPIKIFIMVRVAELKLRVT